MPKSRSIFYKKKRNSLFKDLVYFKLLQSLKSTEMVFKLLRKYSNFRERSIFYFNKMVRVLLN